MLVTTCFLFCLIIFQSSSSPYNHSFSKNFGLYGERLGVLHIVTATAEQNVNCASLVRALARTLYSTCPSYGARIVAKVMLAVHVFYVYVYLCVCVYVSVFYSTIVCSDFKAISKDFKTFQKDSTVIVQ
jgi:hypothetical protein